MMRTRLIWTIISIIIEETALAVIVLLGLPQFGINVPMPALVVMMLAWLAFSIFLYQMGTRALKQKPLSGLTDMADSRGKVVKSLTPHGVVRIKGELWDARTAEGRKIDTGKEVTVTRQEGLKLIVRKSSSKKPVSKNKSD